jgi:hypothetical protein
VNPQCPSTRWPHANVEPIFPALTIFTRFCSFRIS